MTPEAAGLIGAAVGATAGLAGGFIVQFMQARSAKLTRIALLGAQLASATYVVTHETRRAQQTAGPGDPSPSTAAFLDVPAFHDGLLASAELAIIAPDDVADRATKLANAMVHVATQAAKTEANRGWREAVTDLKSERNEFISSMRRSKLQLVVGGGAVAVATGVASSFGRRG